MPRIPAGGPAQQYSRATPESTAGKKLEARKWFIVLKLLSAKDYVTVTVTLTFCCPGLCDCAGEVLPSQGGDGALPQVTFL